MDSFVTRRKRKLNADADADADTTTLRENVGEDEEPTDVKLAILSSLHPEIDQETLLDVLIAHEGSVVEASTVLKTTAPRPKSSSIGLYQVSLRKFAQKADGDGDDVLPQAKKKMISKRGTTMHLYDPVDVAEHTPCTILHNFLPAEEANDLLREMLRESESYSSTTFKLFENVVSSPHTHSFYVESYDEMQAQQTAYLYNGARLSDVRRLTPNLLSVKPKVQEAVNREIQTRIRTRYPNGQKMKYQSPKPWIPNAAFVNCYDGPKQTVGWHSDQLTYLGPRAVIGSLSLGVAREFRVRRVMPKDAGPEDDASPDAEGQISIHLPHNSLLVMHAEMQEEWKHCVAPALAIEPHPIAGNKRINVTYRYYRDTMHPNFTPRCKCGIPCVLRVVQRKKENYGRYFWMCHAGNIPGKEPCTFFEWAEFDDDGDPLRAKRLMEVQKTTG